MNHTQTAAIANGTNHDVAAAQGQLPELVSIVLPTYNRAERLKDAIASCLRQTYPAIELIVVNDGSSDHTGEVIANFARSGRRVREIRQENRGLPRALNTGFQCAHGRYLTWTSDDNEYCDTAIATMVEALQNYPDVGLVYCDFVAIDADGVPLRTVELPEPDQLGLLNCVGACFLYRREVYVRIGEYDPDLYLAEDYDYWLRAARQFKIMHLSGVHPYRYRQHPDSLTSRKKAGQVTAVLRARLKNTEGRGSRALLYLLSASSLAESYLLCGAPRLAIAPGALACLRLPCRLSNWRTLIASIRAAIREHVLVSQSHR